MFSEDPHLACAPTKGQASLAVASVGAALVTHGGIRPSVSRVWGSELPKRACEGGKERIPIPSGHPKPGLKLEAEASGPREGPASF